MADSVSKMKSDFSAALGDKLEYRFNYWLFRWSIIFLMILEAQITNYLNSL